MRANFSRLHIIATIFFLLLAACSRAGRDSDPAPDLVEIEQLTAISLPSGERPRVVATTSLIGDVVGAVGGDAIDLTLVLPPGTDPHGYVATPEDLVAVQDAHVLFVNGLGLEEALLDTLLTAGEGTPIVSISEGIQPLSLDDDEEEHDDGHEHDGVDPHVWFDPTRVEIWADNAAGALGRLDPDRASDYTSHAGMYRESLQALDAWIRTEVAAIPESRRVLVTDHDTLGYFADRYGFEVIGAVIPAFSTTAEPSAQAIAELQQLIGRHGVPAVFVGISVNPTLATRVAEDTGIELVRLYTGSLSEPEGPVATYFAFMRYNVNAIVEALAD